MVTVYRRRRGCSRKRLNVVSADWVILMYMHPGEAVGSGVAVGAMDLL